MTFVSKLQLLQNLNISGINPQSAVFRGNGVFGGAYVQNKDSFATNPINDFGSKSEIIALAKANPHIMEILNKHKIPLKPNLEELQELKRGHLLNSRITAAKIYSSLPSDIKKQVNLENLQQAAMLHDYGKVLIPNEILNKKGKFTPEEKEIMNLHSELGYELLKQKGVKSDVLKLIKYHHQNPKGTGYPNIDKDFTYTIESQILSASDKYSALTEERPYHKALPKNKALEIIKEDADSGIISEEVFNALCKAV